ncbi:uncharacterized protein Tco025E_07507 [Trypanosoma conorhini]|uniref:Uncharacterized protein n=1 Tax=Trypanosoma conorhini TaxID=83891 RepID=A0A3R7MQP4_9TRYP|nr:uncharacterized protein Tco025E_07507 [Trypanosoma conorhini]RNF06674.1 hypothetical protein Tco025E_07507 [Trypanosoma conorhini]
MLLGATHLSHRTLAASAYATTRKGLVGACWREEAQSPGRAAHAPEQRTPRGRGPVRESCHSPEYAPTLRPSHHPSQNEAAAQQRKSKFVPQTPNTPIRMRFVANTHKEANTQKPYGRGTRFSSEPTQRQS